MIVRKYIVTIARKCIMIARKCIIMIARKCIITIAGKCVIVSMLTEMPNCYSYYLVSRRSTLPVFVVLHFVYAYVVYTFMRHVGGIDYFSTSLTECQLLGIGVSSLYFFPGWWSEYITKTQKCENSFTDACT